jgi:hypothetical protein
MNSLADLLKRLNHISEAADEKCPKCDCAPCECDDKDKVDESKKKKPDADGDGIPDWADEDNNKKEVKETALSLLRRYAGIQEAKIEEDDVEEGNEFSGALKAAKDAGEEEFEVGGKKYKVNECGDMPMTNQMSPITAVTNMGVPAQIEMPHAEIEVEPESEQRPMFTLNVRNGDNNLSMTTDSPDEIIHVMKLAGVNKTAEVTKTPADDQDKEVDESGYANTPNNTRERDPKSYGNIQDWGMKGTATAKTHSIPAKQGDNPLGEQAMMEDYKKFKSGK